MEPRVARFCGQCGHELPEGARFCVECGTPVRRPAHEPEPELPPPAVGPTVRLANAAGDQAVVGGTIRLPTAEASPPGLWFAADLPSAEQVVALYVPLRAVVDGWSGRTADGWVKLGQTWADDGTSRDLVRFAITREWFAARGAAGGHRLHVIIEASSLAKEGRTREGFRYQIGTDPPMMVSECYWLGPDKRPRPELPVPQVQLMAPPRATRVSDLEEKIATVSAREAEAWCRVGKVYGLYAAESLKQQRTPVGRGIPLYERLGTRLLAAIGLNQGHYRVQLRHPLLVRVGEWKKLTQQIRQEARDLGLDFDTDAVIEWWMERQGYDGAVFEPNAHPNYPTRTVVAFRRSQIVAVGER